MLIALVQGFVPSDTNTQDFYYTVEDGIASSSIPATSSVVTSTLSAAMWSSFPSSTGTSSSRSPSDTVKTGGAVKNLVGSLVGTTALLSYVVL